MIHNELMVYEINSEKDKEVLHEYLNGWAAVAFRNMFNECITLCKNDGQRTIFSDWWNGQCVSLDEYKMKFSDEDNYEAGSVILHAISRGFG